VTAAGFDPGNAFADWWRWSARVQQAWLASTGGAAAIEHQRALRLRSLLAHARAHSPFYGRRYAHLPAGEERLEQLPPVDKAELMAHFDEWVADPGIRLRDVERFVADPARVGEPYLGRYAVWTSSGSTGRPGIYVQDEDALATYDALLSIRFPGARAAASPLQALAAGGRLAMIAATGGHFAGVVSWERLRRSHPWVAALARTFSVLAPLPQLVAELSQWQPTIVASYPTTLLLLAREREAGRLRIAPRALWSGGETLSAGERTLIERAFDCPVVDGYGASECMQIAFDCGHGRLHLNADWVILEPVDGDRRPVAAGVPSTSVLLTNLANRVQPLIRYDLGDSVTFHDGACACGSPFPAISVDGRRDDIVVLATASGEPVSLVPLALATALEEGARVSRFQIVQTGARSLRVRFDTPAGDDRAAAWRRIVHCLDAFLEGHGLHRIALRLDPDPPRADPVSGKLREVLGLRPRPPAKARRGRRANTGETGKR
jgi:phenylacetate-coenzyme A ligase PaaK-like adenylate-forming protein